MSSPAGWYPDPGGSTALRWFEGERWTDHLAPGAPLPPSGPTTPDGQRLADWGSRLGAYVIDSLVVGIVGSVLSLPFLLSALENYLSDIDELTRSMEAGESLDVREVLDAYLWSGGAFAAVVLIGLVVSATYHVLLWRTRGASLGQSALGLRVRTWDPVGGPLPWRTALLRWGAFYGLAGFLGLVPVVGWFSSLYLWLAGLWPLWDERRQGLHDKVAGTAVVKAVVGT